MEFVVKYANARGKVKSENTEKGEEKAFKLCETCTKRKCSTDADSIGQLFYTLFCELHCFTNTGRKGNSIYGMEFHDSGRGICRKIFMDIISMALRQEKAEHANGNAFVLEHFYSADVNRSFYAAGCVRNLGGILDDDSDSCCCSSVE